MQRRIDSHRPRIRRAGLRSAFAVVATVVLALVVSGCTTTNDEQRSGASAASVAPSNTVVAKASQVIRAAERGTSKIGVATPLKRRPPAGKTIVWLSCSFEQCHETGVAIGQAVKPLGWKLQTIPFDSSNPQTLIAGFLQALQYKPVAVAFSGIPQAVWGARVLPAYRAAHVAIIETLVGPQNLNDVVVANLWNDDDFRQDADIMANWVAADSGGSGNAVVLGVSGFANQKIYAGQFVRTLTQICPKCKATDVEATISQAESSQQMNDLLVSTVQRDPSIKYVITSDGALNTGLPAALSGAGHSGIKISGALGTTENQADILSGTESAFTGQNFGYLGWLVVDAAVRHLDGLTIAPGDGGMPHQLLVKSNVGTPSTDLKVPVNYQAQFENLWRVAR